MNFWIGSKRLKAQIQSRYMSDFFLSDIDFKNKMAWIRTTLKLLHTTTINMPKQKLTQKIDSKN